MSTSWCETGAGLPHEEEDPEAPGVHSQAVTRRGGVSEDLRSQIGGGPTQSPHQQGLFQDPRLVKVCHLGHTHTHTRSDDDGGYDDEDEDVGTLMRQTSSCEDRRMFSGFRSLWMIPLLWRYYTHTHFMSSLSVFPGGGLSALHLVVFLAAHRWSALSIEPMLCKVRAGAGFHGFKGFILSAYAMLLLLLLKTRKRSINMQPVNDVSASCFTSTAFSIW